MGRNQYTRANSAKVAEEQAECYRLKLKALSVRQIARETGLSVGTVHNRLNAHIAELVLPLADEVRKVELDRLDTWLARLEERLDAGEDPVRVVPVAIKVAERRARMLGTDAPERADVTVHEVTQQDIELMELLAEARASQAVDEAGIRGAG